jgi:hypothetical protein
MRVLLLAFALVLPTALSGQTPASPSAPVQRSIEQALTGNWVGVLEYRDYSEPPTSTKRVQLPTWLTIAPAATGLTRHFIYDDGPTKTVEDTDAVSVDVVASTYTETEAGKTPQVQHVSGYDGLKNGHGDLVLTGTGTDNGKPTETRTTLTLRRNLLSWVLEVRPAGSAEPFVFRHRFTFTRAQAPKLPSN